MRPDQRPAEKRGGYTGTKKFTPPPKAPKAPGASVNKPAGWR
jgi:hypothetical protein